MWNLITPLLDPVVATKIHFTKNLDELTQYADMESLPSFITGDESKKTKDEKIKVDPPKPGSLTKPTTAAVQAYEDMIKEYSNETAEWANTDKPAVDAGRLELAKKYRMARIKADNDLRGPTTWKAKGMFNITDEGRLLIDFGSEKWVPVDITERV